MVGNKHERNPAYLASLPPALFFGTGSENPNLPGIISSLGRYVFGSEISYNKAPPRLPGLGC
jgi:hypothetical protein